MPTYEFECKSCESHFDVIQKASDPYPASCPVCHEGPVVKVFSAVGIIFKGSGFHVNDYKKPGDKGAAVGSETSVANKPSDSASEPPAPSTDSSKAGAAESKTEVKPSENKTETAKVGA